MSFFEKLEIWKEENILLQHIFLNFKDYKNLNFNFPIGFILIFFMIAFPIAVFLINHTKNTVATCIKQLLRHEALSEDSAKNLSQLRLSKYKGLRKMLLSSGELSSMVKIAGYKKPSYDEYMKAKKEKRKIETVDFDNAKIYLSENNIDHARDIASIGTSSIWKPILVSIAGVIVIALLFVFMPTLLDLLNSSLNKK